MDDANDYEEIKEENILINNRKTFVDKQKYIKYYPTERKERLKIVVNNYKNNMTDNLLKTSETRTKDNKINDAITFPEEFNSILNSFIFVDYNIKNKYNFNKFNINSSPEKILDNVELSAVSGERKKDIIMKNILNKFKQQYSVLDYNNLLHFLKTLFNSQVERNLLFAEYGILKNEIMISDSRLDIISEVKDYIIENIVNPDDNVNSDLLVNNFLNHFDEDKDIICQIPKRLSENLFSHDVTIETNKYYSMYYDDSYRKLLNLYESQFSSIMIDIIVSNSKNIPKTENSITTENITLTIDNTPINDIKLIITDFNYIKNSNVNIKFEYSDVDKTSNMFKCISILERCKEVNEFPNTDFKLMFFTRRFITEYLPNVYYAKLFDFSLKLFATGFYSESINLCKFISSKVQINDSMVFSSSSESNKIETLHKLPGAAKSFEPHNDNITIETQPIFQQKIKKVKTFVRYNFSILNILLLFTLITILVVYFMMNQKSNKKAKSSRESFTIKKSYNLFNY